MKSVKKFVKKYPQIWFALYIPIYCIWFVALESWTDRNFTLLHCSLDDMTPFISWFIIPYYLWFPFVGIACLYYFFLAERKACIKLYSSLVLGMTITLIIYTVWPNALNLRPVGLDQNFILDRIVGNLYKVDTDTNVCPSLHVLNTLVIDISIFESGLYKKCKPVTVFIMILSAFIIMSTVFLKQHSYIDIFAAFILAAILYLIVYVPERINSLKKKKPA